MTEQCEKFGVERVTDVINDVVLEGDVKKLISAKGEYCGKTLIIATGAFARPIGCKVKKNSWEKVFPTVLHVMRTSSKILKYM